MSNRVKPSRSDRRRTLVTPEGIALPVVLASRATRLGALLIDLLILAVGFILVIVILGFTGFSLFDLDENKLEKASDATKHALMAVVIVYILISFLTRYAYFLFFELGPRGATPGKRMTGIRIAARNGGRLTPEMVLARNLIRDIELFLPLSALGSIQSDGTIGWLALGWFLIFALFPFFNRDRLRAGDVIAGTWVIEAPKRKLETAISTGTTATSGTSTATGASYRFSDAELTVYGEYELQTLERVLRENRDDALVAVHEAICRKIGWSPGAGDERAFLEAYYTQLRARLEAGMRMGRRKADKHA